MVELRTPTFRDQGPPNGDFLKILRIVKSTSQSSVILRGHSLVREQYVLGRGCDGVTGRLNELAMHFKVHEGDNRPAEVQGLIDISSDEVRSTREVIITDTPYPMLSWKDSVVSSTKWEGKRDLLECGPLVCRWSRTDIISPNGKIYGGVMNLFTKNQAMALARPRTVTAESIEIPFSVPLEHQDTSSCEALEASPTRNGRMRSPSFEVLDNSQPKHATQPKRIECNLFDMCCCSGGASCGAANAGLRVIAGLDHDKQAMQAWELNNPGGLPFCMDVFEFLRQKLFKICGRIHVLNICLSCDRYSTSQFVLDPEKTMTLR